MAGNFRTDEERYLRETNDNSKRELGHIGFLVVATGATVDTTNHSNGYYAIKAVGADATVTATSIVGDSVTDLVLGQGDVLFGRFSSVTAVAGTLLAYRS